MIIQGHTIHCDSHASLHLMSAVVVEDGIGGKQHRIFPVDDQVMEIARMQGADLFDESFRWTAYPSNRKGMTKIHLQVCRQWVQVGADGSGVHAQGRAIMQQ